MYFSQFAISHLSHILNIIDRSLSLRRLDWSLLVNYSKQLHLRTMKPAGLPPIGMEERKEEKRRGVQIASLQSTSQQETKWININDGKILAQSKDSLPCIS